MCCLECEDIEAEAWRHAQAATLGFGGFLKLGTFLGLPIIRTVVFWGLYWGPPILRKYHLLDDCDHCWSWYFPKAQSGGMANSSCFRLAQSGAGVKVLVFWGLGFIGAWVGRLCLENWEGLNLMVCLGIQI